jgi:UDP-glucose 4-epimerase
MRALVTGGAGFIGSHLVKRLLRAGTSVTVLDNLRRGSKEALAGHPGDLTFIEGDIRDRGAVRDATQGADVVFHLAAQSSVMTADADTNYTLSTNVEGTRNVLEAAQAEQVRRFVFTSSREVYGDPTDLPVSETASLNPKNTYGVSKTKGEKLCREFEEGLGRGLEISILRLANVYGPGDRDRVLPIFLENAIHGRPLKLYGGQQMIDFVWIDVVVDALIRMANGPAIEGPINIGSGKGTTVAELARRVVAATGSTSTIEIAPAREIEVSRFIADIDKARQVLGTEPPADPLFRLAALVNIVGAPA